MKILFDFFPVLIFFITYKMIGIYWATFSLILMSYLQLAFLYIRDKEVETTYKLMVALITVFGGLTLLLHNELYIKWKPTVINWMFAIIFAGSHWIGKRTVLERLLADKVKLQVDIWSRLNLMWVVFFTFMGFLNIYVAYQFSTDAWVNFKLFGVVGVTLIFSILQGVYLAKYIEE